MLRYVVVFIGTTVYGHNEHRPTYRPRTRWRSAIEKMFMAQETLSVSILEWIEASLPAVTTKRHQRVHNATRSLRRAASSVAIAMSVLALQANATIATEHFTALNTVGPLTNTGKVVKGFGGSRTANVQSGTLKWKWEDDMGVKHTFLIPHSYYVPDGKVRLLSPQHWAQTQATPRHSLMKCGESTSGKECVLYWDGGQYKRTIELN